MNKVTLVIKRLEYGRSEATFQCEGDINEWSGKRGKKKWFYQTQCISSDITHNEVHTFYYESHLEKFVDRFQKVVDEIITI